MTTATKSVLEILSEQLFTIKNDLPTDWEATDHFKNDLDLDSFDLVEFVARIEQIYRIIIPDEDLEKMINMECTVAYVQEKIYVNA